MIPVFLRKTSLKIIIYYIFSKTLYLCTILAIRKFNFRPIVTGRNRSDRSESVRERSRAFVNVREFINIFTSYSIVRTFVTPTFSGGKRRKTPEKPGKARIIRIFYRKSPEKKGNYGVSMEKPRT